MSDVLENLRVVGGPKLVRELIDLFARTAPERIAAARAGIEHRDLDTVQRAMHSLKSSAGQLGITVIQDACRRAELSATSGDAVGAASAVAEVEEAWPETSAWLTEQGRL